MTTAGPGQGTVFLSALSRDLELACAPTGGLAAYLSPAEAESARKYTRAGDRLDYAASHALFRLLAARQLGRQPLAARHLQVTRSCAGCGSTAHGKPEVAGLSLSLSRSHGAVMAAAGPAGTPVGADIELVPGNLFKGFDDYVASTDERLGLAPQDVPARLRLWVAKEAVLKAAGLGLAVTPAAVHLAPVDAGTPERTLLRADCPGTPQVHGLTAAAVAAPDGYAAAVSAASDLPAATLPLADLLLARAA
ncbi:4'-phosphopantetheinyl transferase superfamily protein [Pseudarthrobacter sp. MEB009]|uniref:4'-phosphopantetheinyl transferase family protein n=1 Tax=Pseudarthrobacter sp. MEB009 TaxID=3040326 RepID=UPI00255297B8|nr:4'-phosphopantetheinyl transferase superfamily protein [Pseudarthrobacter sp. MEB009]